MRRFLLAVKIKEYVLNVRPVAADKGGNDNKPTPKFFIAFLLHRPLHHVIDSTSETFAHMYSFDHMPFLPTYWASSSVIILQFSLKFGFFAANDKINCIPETSKTPGVLIDIAFIYRFVVILPSPCSSAVRQSQVFLGQYVRCIIDAVH